MLLLLAEMGDLSGSRAMGTRRGGHPRSLGRKKTLPLVLREDVSY